MISFLNRARRAISVVQVHVAELVNLLFAMPCGDERHLGDQNLRFEHGRTIV